MITEERMSVLGSESLIGEYLSTCRNTIWPSIRASGGSIICVLSGYIGKPTSHILQMTSYKDLESWKTAQGAWSAGPASLLTEETVRLLKPVATRPKETIPPEDRRPVYGYRTFSILPNDLSEFVRCSEEGIWPQTETMGACILGMWVTLASTSPLEVILLTGYHNISLWEETEITATQSKSLDTDATIWDRDTALRNRRKELTLKTFVELMRSADF